MKTTDTFQISFEWWEQVRPHELRPTGLGEAMREYEAAKAQLLEVPNDPEIAEAQTALDAALADFNVPLPQGASDKMETTRRIKLERARGKMTKLSKTKLEEFQHIAILVKSTLDEVESMRMRGLALCIWPLFPDTRSVLTQGAQVVQAEKAALDTLVHSILAGLMDPMIQAIVREMTGLITKHGWSATLQARIPRTSPRHGSSPTDPKQVEFQKLFLEADGSGNSLKNAVDALGESLAVARPIYNLAKQNPAHHVAAIDIFDRADKIRASGQNAKKELFALLDDWAGDLIAGNPGWEDKKRREQ